MAHQLWTPSYLFAVLTARDSFFVVLKRNTCCISKYDAIRLTRRCGRVSWLVHDHWHRYRAGNTPDWRHPPYDLELRGKEEAQHTSLWTRAYCQAGRNIRFWLPFRERRVRRGKRDRSSSECKLFKHFKTFSVIFIDFVSIIVLILPIWLFSFFWMYNLNG